MPQPKTPEIESPTKTPTDNNQALLIFQLKPLSFPSPTEILVKILVGNNWASYMPLPADSLVETPQQFLVNPLVTL